MTVAENLMVENDNPFGAALKTLFSGGDPEAFLEATKAKLSQCERLMTETSRKNRHATEQTIYNLTDARDALSSHSAQLDDAHQAGVALSRSVRDKANLLEERLRIRRNLDAALTLVSQTRKFIRVYARIDDIIHSRRLHTAVRMLRMAEDEAKSIAPDAVLRDLFPQPGRLRGDISTHAKRALQSWLGFAESAHSGIGKYALTRVQNQARASRARLHGTTESATSSSSDSVPRATSQPPWIPVLTPDIPQLSPTSDSIMQPGDLARRRKFEFSYPATNPRSASQSGHISSREVPTLYLRPLLQCIQVYSDLGELPELCAEYRRERESTLRGILARCDNSRSSASVEGVLESIAGFFVVERTVLLEASVELVPESVVTKEFWRMSFARIVASIKMLERAPERPIPVATLRQLRSLIETFATAYNFPL